MTQDEHSIVSMPDALVPSTTDVQLRVETMIANRATIVERVKPLLIERGYLHRCPNEKPSLGKPGAEKLAALFGLTADFTVDKETMDVIGTTANGKQYIAYICNLNRGSRVAGQGRGATFIEWERNSYRMVFSQEWETIKMTLSEGEYQGPLQGKSKSTDKPYTYWRVKESPVFDQLALNKAIKMAQKSAFVDAVIRTTGMSDLFTQDIEDMAEPPLEAQKRGWDDTLGADEPFPGKPAYEQAQAKPATVNAEGQRVVDALDDGMPCDIAGCGGTLRKRNGVKGPFYGCSNYSKGCRNTKNV